MVCKRPSVYACACARACFRACAAARACAHAVPVPALPLERTAALAAAPALAALPTPFGAWQESWGELVALGDDIRRKHYHWTHVRTHDAAT